MISIAVRTNKIKMEIVEIEKKIKDTILENIKELVSEGARIVQRDRRNRSECYGNKGDMKYHNKRGIW